MQITSGTITVDAGGTTVTGVNTNWLSATQPEIVPGLSVLAVDAAPEHQAIIAQVESNTLLRLAEPWPGGAHSNAAYTITIDFTSLGLPLFDATAVEFSALWNRAMTLIGAHLTTIGFPPTSTLPQIDEETVDIAGLWNAAMIEIASRLTAAGHAPDPLPTLRAGDEAVAPLMSLAMIRINRALVSVGSEVIIHLRYVAAPSSTFADSLFEIDYALNLAGLHLFIKSAETLNAPSYLEVDPLSPEIDALFQLGRGGVSAGEIVLYFIETLTGGFRGYAPVGGDNAVLAQSAGIYTAAHEIGHCFGLVHVTDTDNLMYQFTTEYTNQPPDLTPSQISTMLQQVDLRHQRTMMSPFLTVQAQAGQLLFTGQAPTVSLT